MKFIHLSNGEFAYVDDADYDIVRPFRWHEHDGYARTWIRTPKGRYRVYMHRLIMGTPKGSITDHVNRNRLDNRRANLRIIDAATNSRNRGPLRKRHRRYKGVRKHGNSWRAVINSGRTVLHLGTFPDVESAARAYDAAARELSGEHTFLNFPSQTELTA
jgi:hypothetical protein